MIYNHGGPSGDHRDKLAKIDFSVSLNAYGPPKEVVNAIHSASIDTYPDPTSLEPRTTASIHWNIDRSCILFGAGASEFIHFATQALINRGDTALIASHTYGEYRRAALIAGAQVLDVDGMYIDIQKLGEKIENSEPKITYLCNPNNPTGQLILGPELKYIANLCQSVNGYLMLDQSYDGFLADPLGTPALREHPAVIHIRSITKDFALAGVRAGFLVAPESICQKIDQIRIPWSASTVAQNAAVATFTAGAALHVNKTIPLLRDERERIDKAFNSFGFETVSGHTHTLLCKVGNATDFSSKLLQEFGLRVRDCTSFNLPEYIRVAARTVDENSILIDAISNLEAV